MWWLNEINDYSETYYPILLGIQKGFRENFSIPIWRWDIFGGMPLFGDPFAMLLNPINWLSLVIDLKWFFPLAALASFFIGVFGMKKMLKEFGIKQNVADFLAIFYMLLPTSIAHIKAGHLNIYEAVSFYPWVIYYLKKWIEKGEIKNSLFLSIASVLILFSHPGMFYILLFVFIPSCSYFVVKKKVKIRNYILFWLILIGLSAVYILPTLELNQYINRTSLSRQDIVPVWTIKSVIGGLFFPYLKINQLDQEAVLYPTIAVGILAIYGFLALGKKIKFYVLFLLFVLLIIALGSFTPIYYSLIKIFPFAGVFRVSSRFWYLALLVIVILSAMGLSRIKNKKLSYLIKIFILVEIISFAVLRLFLPGRYGSIINFANFDKYFDNSIDKFRLYSTTHSLSQRKMVEANAGIVDGEYPLQLSSFINYLQRAAGYSYNNQYSVIHPPYQVYKNLPQPNAAMLGKLNVLYVVSPYELSDANFSRVAEDQGLILYKNSQFKEFLWSEDTQIKLLKYKNFGNKVEAEFEVGKETRINWGVRNYPGWNVIINGKNISINNKEVWYEFELQKGQHKFEAVFISKLYNIGFLISLLTSLVIVIYFRLYSKLNQ
ncbi:MAG: hypothetical protein NC935_05075 [Candidatus Omnitrophica bacterium]|nr:hypothetical protein [Candidatus Omnitrophota bacterium]